MTKTKFFHVLLAASFMAGFAITPRALAKEAEGEYLPDVENLAAEVVSNSIILNWDTVAGADSYTVYYDTLGVEENSGNYENQILVENATEYTPTDIAPEVLYYFSIAAEDSTGQFLGSYNFSNEVMVTSPAIAEEEIEEIIEPPVEEVVMEEEIEEIIEPPVEEVVMEEEIEEIIEPPMEEEIKEPTDDIHAAAETEAESRSLPESGPEVALILAISGIGAYIWKRQKAKS